MRKDSLLTLTALALVLTLGGCSKDDDAGTDNDGIIRFGVSEFPESRAAINSADDLKTGDAFDVWGYYTSPTAGKIDVFKGENGSGIPVTKSNTGWGYAGGDRYWVKEMPYTFYAVYPSGKAIFNEEQQSLVVTAFECPTRLEDEANVTDLMLAFNKDMNGSNPAPVNLPFKHLLTRVNFAVKLADELPAGYKVNVNSITFRAYTTGDLSIATETMTPTWTTSRESDNLALFDYEGKLENHIGITASGSTNSPVDITPANYDLYLIPQSMNETIHNVVIKYRLMNDKQEGEAGYHYIDNEVTIPLSKVTQNWNPGESLTYTITISKYNVTVILNVGDWADGNSGNENVDFE